MREYRQIEIEKNGQKYDKILYLEKMREMGIV